MSDKVRLLEKLNRYVRGTVSMPVEGHTLLDLPLRQEPFSQLFTGCNKMKGGGRA
jgi:hypothetical protein